MGLVDAVVPGDHAIFDGGVLEYATELASDPAVAGLLDRKRAAREVDEQRRPLDTYRVGELAEMSRDIFDDRNGFAQARHAFITKAKAGALHHTSGRPEPARRWARWLPRLG